MRDRSGAPGLIEIAGTARSVVVNGFGGGSPTTVNIEQESTYLPERTMESSVFTRVETLLKSAGVPFSVLQHEPVFTSEEAARVRGVELSSGAKALVCKADDKFLVIVLPADRRLDSKGVRRGLGSKRLRFASREEVSELTGLVPGAIPPFGSLFGLKTLCDERLGENESINFNAGDNRISVNMLHADYLRIERPELGLWAE